jgi:hypothetical protein
MTTTTIRIRTKDGSLLVYELRGINDGIELSADVMTVTGWIHEYDEMQTDTGPIRTTRMEQRVEAKIALSNLAYYELLLPA